MPEPRGDHHDGRNAPELERARQLFRFLRAFAERNVPVVRVLSDQAWTLLLRELPQHPAIAVGEVRLATAGDTAAGEEHSDDTPLLSVRRPKQTPAPRPPAEVREYLQSGWDRADGTIEVLPTRNIRKGSETVTERFTDDPARVAALEEWRVKWQAWADAERPPMLAMRIFERLFDLHGRIERESEQVELMLGDGRLRWLQTEGYIDHPVLLQRVELEFDPNVPEFRILDADRGPELYSALLLGEDTISAAQLNQLREELEKGGYHPLARQGTSGYLRRLVQLLSPRSVFHEAAMETRGGRDPILLRDPVLFLRKRSAGYAAAFDRVLQDLEARQDLPVSLTRLVGVEPPAPAVGISHQDSPWGEPPDVLLSKPANMEQVQIARALEQHRAVIVQGPPGTGKSHTIANLVGHLVAHGKRVLVTSHTTKALRVLRDHVVATLRPLCVAVLENDLEGRKQMEQAVRGILSRLTSSSDEMLSREVAQLAESRAALNSEIRTITASLREAREAELLPIVVAGEQIDPAEGARWVRDNASANDWIPEPVQLGAPVPLSPSELRELYASNARITLEEDDELRQGLPSPDSVPDPQSFTSLVDEARTSESEDLASFWDRSAHEREIDALADLLTLVHTAAVDLSRLERWQRSIVAAGHAGGTEHDIWAELARQVSVAVAAWEKSRAMLLENDVTVPEALTNDETRRAIGEIVAHLGDGGALGALNLLLHPTWKAVIRDCKVNGSAPTTIHHFRAIATFLALEDGRKKLAIRWLRQAEPIGLPKFAEMGSPPEPTLREFAGQFEELLAWWRKRWAAIETAMSVAGFRWPKFRNREVARSLPVAPFERDAAIVGGPMQQAVASRLAVARAARAARLLKELEQMLEKFSGAVCLALRAATRLGDATAYESAWTRLCDLRRKEPLCHRRRELLARLAQSASAWAMAIQNRLSVHGLAELPGDPEVAWRWRQLHEEINRRAALDEVQLTRRLHQRRASLRDVTAELIDRRAWLGQLRRTDLNARQALQGWADTQKKIGKGTGKRVPALQAEARRLLDKARGAVPVWIMPLARVAESFDATRGRFDVVIVDEASQSDVTGLLAWYLGERIAVVGDHEQVSPLAVGQDVGAMAALIAQHLVGIPNSHLYDGKTSVYDLARQSFGGTIALREHFRCMPDIIEFSNELAYNLEIRPLRNPAAAPQPHVIEYVVPPQLLDGGSGKTNRSEAYTVVALLKAATEAQEYADKTLGAITLLGDEQAGLIQDLALRLVGAVELERRRFVAGNAPQFQGDERHVIFLSMVDVPTGSPLPLRQTEAFKQRYNVAASRAKDQLWLVHSLDPNRDLKAGDLRRLLIEYVRDPGARRRSVQEAAHRAESPFECAVIERLVMLGYRVESQVWVGRYRIDMVVSDSRNQVALECDGDRYHGIDQIPEDMARQAVLERAGWRFVRIRGTRYYRDPEGTMAWVLSELRRLGVEPMGAAPSRAKMEQHAIEFRDRVVRRAWDIMREQGWLPLVVSGSVGGNDS